MSEITCYQCQTPLDANAAACPKCGLPQILRGRYRIRRLLGQGGFGVVYEAVDLDLNRHYAIKLITATSPAIREQVAIEAQILAQHARRLPFMPEIYDIWSDTGRTALVMEYIDGATLGDLIDQHGAWPANVVGRFLYTILNDLDRLHGLGIVHRDIKPDNVKRTADGRYVLLDFGIAKRDSSTQSGAKAFSLYYASPEQASGKATDVRSDLYSLGATAYHLLTGNPPAPASARQVMDARLLPPTHFYPRTPPVLNDLIMRMLELAMDDRPQSAKAALQMLTAKSPAAAGAPSPPPPPAESVIAKAPAPFSSAGMATQVVRPAEPPPPPVAPTAPPASRPRWAMWLLAGLLLAALGGGALAMFNRGAAVSGSPTTTPAAGADATPTQVFVASDPLPSATVDAAAGESPPTADPPADLPTEAPVAIDPPTAAPTEVPVVIDPPTAAPTEIPAPTAVPLSAELQQVVDLVNEQRALRGVAPLNVSAELVAAAQAHSEDMAANNFFSDTGSDGSDPKTRINRTGYIASRWVENIAAGYSQPFEVVQSWLDNPANLETLISADMRDVGVGYAANPSSQYGRYWTILYARP